MGKGLAVKVYLHTDNGRLTGFQFEGREPVTLTKAPIMDREQLIAATNSEVYDTNELQEHFTVISFMEPFVRVKRKSDGKRGTMEFQNMPRLYYCFVEE